jgi:hypothetical protein
MKKYLDLVLLFVLGLAVSELISPSEITFIIRKLLENNMAQSVIRVESPNVIELNVVDDGHKISWKLDVKGRMEFKAQAQKGGDWLTFWTEEMPYGLNARNRATVVTFDKPAVWALRDMLNDICGDPLQTAIARLEDVMKNDDGQAWDEARKFIEKHKKA